MVNSVSNQQQLQQQQLQEQQLQEQLEQQLQTQAQQFDVNVAAAVLDVSEQMVNHQQHQLDQSEEQHVVAMHDDDVIGGDEVVSQDDNGQGDKRDDAGPWQAEQEALERDQDIQQQLGRPGVALTRPAIAGNDAGGDTPGQQTGDSSPARMARAALNQSR